MTSTLSSKIESGPLRLSNRKFHRYANQSFRRLAKRSSDVGLLFTDDQFKQSDRMVYQTSTFRSRFNIGKIVWKRPKQLLQENDCNFAPSLLPLIKNDHNHLFVGHSPNPWFVAAALAISQHRALFDQLINVDEQNFSENGIVRFTIWQMGTWHKVVIDDRIPSIDSEPIFTRPLWSSCSWWVPMLEKAYAKLHGSYEAMITAGSLHSALIDFSGGGSVETIDLSNSSPEDIWQLIFKEFQSKSLLVLKTKEFKPAGSAPFGLISDRHYLIRNVKKPIGTLKRFLSNSSSQSSDNPPLLITNTIADGVKNFKSSNPKKGLQELWILSNNITTLFDSLTICRPYQYNKDHIHQLMVKKPVDGGLQFSFDVRLPNWTSVHSIDETTDVHFNLIQKSSPIIPIGFRIYSIELNRKFKVHNFSLLPMIITIDPVQLRNLISSIRLPHGRYLLKPICPGITSLLVSIYSTKVYDLRQLTYDMPKHQLLSFLSPVYPSAVTRITVIGAEGLERQDRFGTANPYCIIRCGRKFIKSSIQHETLMPCWKNFSAIFYHREINKLDPIWIEIWHRSILVDYFLGAVKLKPKIMITVENNDDNVDKKPNESSLLLSQKNQYKSNFIEDQQQIEHPKKINNLINQKQKPINNEIIPFTEDNDITYNSKDQISKDTQPLITTSVKNNVLRLQMTDKKGQTKRPGFVLLHAETVEDLKYF